MNIKACSLMYLISVGITLSAQFTGYYSVKDLGVFTDLPNPEPSKPQAINSHGQVAAVKVIGGAYRALLYGGAWTNLGTLGGSKSVGAGLNDAGRLVGYSLTGLGTTNAFLWTPGGTDGALNNPQMKSLPTLGVDNIEAYDINNAGQITGFATTAGGKQHAFRYSGGVMTDIGTLLGTTLPNSFGYGINDVGHIAGTAYNQGYTTPHAFFSYGTTAVDIGNLGGKGSSALALNSSDHIVGYYTSNEGFDRAFRYAGGVMTDLGTLGGNWSYALAINNYHAIVGGSFTDSSDSTYHSFLWVNNTLVDLNTRLDGFGTGWTLVEAYGINDLGQIVGLGIYGGAQHAFLLNPCNSDGDTFNDYQEIVMGTNPHNSSSTLGVVMSPSSGGTEVFKFTSVLNKSYRIQRNDDFPFGLWQTVPPDKAGTGGWIPVYDSTANGLPKAIYRVVVLY